MIGADAEFFVKDLETGKPVPACGLFGGAKGAPKQLTKDLGILEDGAAVEFNYTPSNDVQSFFMYTLRRTPRYLNQFFPKFAVIEKPYASFVGLKKYKQAMVIGCDSDYDAYAEYPDMPRDIPDISKFKNTRFAGLHIHLSYPSHNDLPAHIVARLIDLLVLAPLACNVHKTKFDMHLGGKRKEFYGIPGLHRPKPYGIEYRTFSNYMALPHCNSWGNLAASFDIVHRLLQDPANVNKMFSLYINTDWGALRKAIVEYDLPTLEGLTRAASKQLR